MGGWTWPEARRCRWSGARRRVAAGVCQRLGGRPQLARERLHDLPADRAVLLDERAELPPGEAPADEVGAGGDGRHPQAVVDQGDLAEVVAGPQHAPVLAADRDVRLAGLDDVEGRPAGALLGDGLARPESPLLEDRADLLELAPVEVTEQPRRPEHVGGHRGTRRGGRGDAGDGPAL